MSQPYPTRVHTPSWKDLEAEIPVLRGFLRFRCRDAFEIDDIVQETLLRSARYRRHLHDPSKLRSWVLRIALNVLSDRIRRETRLGTRHTGDDDLISMACPDSVPEVRTVEVDGVISPVDEVMELIDGALGKLRDRDRNLVSSYYGGAMSCAETAACCEVPLDLVKVRLFRARKKLRSLVKGELVNQRNQETADVLEEVE